MERSGSSASRVASPAHAAESGERPQVLYETNPAVAEALLDAGMGVWTWDVEGAGIQWSRGLWDLFGLDPKETRLTLDAWRDRIHPADRERVDEAVARLLDGRDTRLFVIHRVIGAAECYVECRARRHGGSNEGGGIRVAGTMSDVTAREQAARSQEARAATVLATAPDFIASTDRHGVISYLNRALPKGEPRDQLGRSLLEWMHSRSIAAVRSAFDKAWWTGELVSVEAQSADTSSGTRWWLVRVGPIVQDGQTTGLVVHCSDVTARRNTEDALRESEARLRSAADSLPFAFWISDPQGRIQVQNPVSVAWAGDLVGGALQGMSSDASGDPVRANFLRALGGELVIREFDVATKLGSKRLQQILAPVRSAAEIRGVLGVDIDLTDQRALEERLFQAEKEESISRLAGNIAHDFNNLLTAILGYAALAERAVSKGSPAHVALTRLEETASRGTGLTSQLLAFARRRPVDAQTLDLADVVAVACEQLGRILPPGIELVVERARPLPPVRVDRGQFEQVVIHLAMNARDAMPTGGRLAIETRGQQLDSDRAGTLGVPPGPYVCVAVRDTGRGMDREVQRRIFEPFFTTRPGQSSGLGLAIAKGAVAQAGGTIRVETSPGGGSCFEVLIPVVGYGDEPTPFEHRRSPRDGGNETVLVVEDDPHIRSLLGEILRACGYRVLEAGDGDEALGLAGDEIEVLVTDVSLPRVGGREVARLVRALHPGLKVLYASGAEEVRPEELGPGERFLPKPFHVDALLAGIRELLDREIRE
jgi:PAS domain S-box-containing protein